MRNVYAGIADLLAHCSRDIGEGLDDAMASIIDVMYFPQMVSLLYPWNDRRGFWFRCLLIRMDNQGS
jgi:hypothetical protein